jgi:hypothetical protein
MKPTNSTTNTKFLSIYDYKLYILSIVNLRVEKNLRITKRLEQQQIPIIIPPYWYGLNLYGFPMGTPMMLISTNPK